MLMHTLEWNSDGNVTLHFTQRNDISYYEIIKVKLSGFRRDAGRHLKYGWNDHELEGNNA